MKQCTVCGKSFSDEIEFCTNCGGPLKYVESSAHDIGLDYIESDEGIDTAARNSPKIRRAESKTFPKRFFITSVFVVGCLLCVSVIVSGFLKEYGEKPVETSISADQMVPESDEETHKIYLSVDEVILTEKESKKVLVSCKGDYNQLHFYNNTELNVYWGNHFGGDSRWLWLEAPEEIEQPMDGYVRVVLQDSKNNTLASKDIHVVAEINAVDSNEKASNNQYNIHSSVDEVILTGAESKKVLISGKGGAYLSLENNTNLDVHWGNRFGGDNNWWLLFYGKDENMDAVDGYVRVLLKDENDNTLVYKDIHVVAEN